MITPFFPNKTTGAKKIFMDIIKGLSENNEVFLISRIEPDEKAIVKEVERYCKIICLYEFKTPKKRRLIGILQIVLSYLMLAIKARRAIRQSDVDIIQVSYTDFGLFLHKSRSIKLPMVMDTHDVNTLVAEREYKSAKSLALKVLKGVLLLSSRYAERYTLSRFDLITARSPNDTRIFQQFNLNIPVVTVRQPVEIPSNLPLSVRERQTNSLLFVGAMHRELNVRYILYFYKNILPLIREKISDAVLYVVGSNPDDKLLVIAKEDNRFKVTGFVEDVTSFYRKNMVFVSPILIGGGVMVKNLEAMSNGLPVVTTTLGNEGIEAVHNRDILIADDPKDFAESVVRLLQDKELHKMISMNSIAFIRKNFSQKDIIKTIEDAYYNIVNGRSIKGNI